MCWPVIVLGWRYSAFIFLAVNSAAFVFILYAYVVMFSSITDSRLNLRSTQQLQDRAIAKRFAFIVATDFLCWMPIAIIKIVAIASKWLRTMSTTTLLIRLHTVESISQKSTRTWQTQVRHIFDVYCNRHICCTFEYGGRTLNVGYVSEYCSRCVRVRNMERHGVSASKQSLWKKKENTECKCQAYLLPLFI